MKSYRALALLASLPVISTIHAQDVEIVNSPWEKTVIYEGQRCNTVVADDFTGDGAVDLIASSGGMIRLFIAPDWQEVNLGPYGNCIHSETFDVDGDGDPDYLAAEANRGIFWLENPGKSGAKWTYRLVDDQIQGIHCLLKADVNRDGKLDLLANNFKPEGPYADSSAWLEVPENPTAEDVGNWQIHVFADKTARGGSHYFGFGDVNGDGWGDIAMGAKGAPFEDGNWFGFWTNPGSAETVQQPWEKTMLQENQEGATNILPADLNGDGAVDFFASRGHGKGILWYEAPNWTPHQIHPAIASPHSLAVADIDGDGDIDGATCGYESQWVEWYENDGKGNFTIHRVGNEQASYDLRLVDMDADGRLDIVIAGQGSKNVVWYRNPGK